MEYKGFKIGQDLTGYAPENMRFHFSEIDGEIIIGIGESIDDCIEQIDEILLNIFLREDEDKEIFSRNWNSGNGFI